MLRLLSAVLFFGTAFLLGKPADAAEPALAKNPTISRLLGPAQSVAQADAILAQQLPNMNPLFGQQNGRGIAVGPVDNSQQLIDVIQRCLSPNTWDVNGGQGVVRYYAPAQSLVVRQTSEMHEQLQRVIPLLRK
jgi:hypothetical protein